MNQVPDVPDLTIALPAYEEAVNLDVLLPELQHSIQQLGIRAEILVADTETPRDATPDICRKHGALWLPRAGGSDYSHAVRTALNASRGKWVVFMDADGSHNPDLIPELWAERESHDLVIASRYIEGGKTENPAVLIFLSRVVNIVFRFILGLRCADVSNSFRLYRGDDVRALRLECEHFDIVEEILVKLCLSRPGYRVKEVPFTFEKRKAGRTKRDLLVFAIGYLSTLRRLYRLKREALRSAEAAPTPKQTSPRKC